MMRPAQHLRDALLPGPRLCSHLLFILLLVILLPSTIALTVLDDDSLRSILSSSSTNDYDIVHGKLLAPLLIPRVPGSEGSRKVQQHFVNFFETHLPEWEIIWQNSTSKTPATGTKDVPFRNLIFRRDPPWAGDGETKRLTMAAHYDSLITPEGFIGAVDSAAPCAMLMDMARGIDKALTTKWKHMEQNGEAGIDEAEGIQILLLDGEEAFVHWTETDSLYGSRSLAEEWEHQASTNNMATYRTPLDAISLFVLLDLLGSAEPSVPSYFLPTHWAYRAMADVETRLRKLDILETKPEQNFLPQTEKAANMFGRGFVEDDHVPFMRRGVEVLHIIPSPFPPVWHKIVDDGEHLDLPTVRDWSRIVTAFAAEWLDLQGFMLKDVASMRNSVPGFETGRSLLGSIKDCGDACVGAS